jgi:hypothetical protein
MRNGCPGYRRERCSSIDAGAGRTGNHRARCLSEEAFESFAAQVRPFTIRDEPVYWENILDVGSAAVAVSTSISRR